MAPATRTRAALASDLRSPATARREACAPSCGYRCERPIGQPVRQALGALFLPLPLAGEVAALARVRRVGEIPPRILAAAMRRHPHPSPPPQAGEGVQPLFRQQALQLFRVLG